MQIENIDVNSYPGSEKVYVEGKIHPIKVAMRRVNLTPTVKIIDGEKMTRQNGSVYVYDTSGVYTDPEVKIDINEGLPRLREEWLKKRDDLEQLPHITSDYGRMRLFAAKKGKASHKWHWQNRVSSPRKWNMWLSVKTIMPRH